MDFQKFRKYIDYAVSVSEKDFLNAPHTLQTAIVRMLGAVEQLEFVADDACSWKSVTDSWEKKAFSLFYALYRRYTGGTLDCTLEGITSDYLTLNRFADSLMVCSPLRKYTAVIRDLAVGILAIDENAGESLAPYTQAFLLLDHLNDSAGVMSGDFNAYDRLLYMCDTWQEDKEELTVRELVRRLFIMEETAALGETVLYDSHIAGLRARLDAEDRRLSYTEVTASDADDYAAILEYSILLFDGEEYLGIRNTMARSLGGYLIKNAGSAIGTDKSSAFIETEMSAAFVETNMPAASLVVENMVREGIRNLSLTPSRA